MSGGDTQETSVEDKHGEKTMRTLQYQHISYHISGAGFRAHHCDMYRTAGWPSVGQERPALLNVQHPSTKTALDLRSVSFWRFPHSKTELGKKAIFAQVLEETAAGSEIGSHDFFGRL